MKINPLFLIDFYKADHRRQYPTGTTKVYSNFTPRSNKYAYENSKEVVVFGIQYFIKEYLINQWTEGFFNQPKEEVVSRYTALMDRALGPGAIESQHIADLHDLGYLPILLKALPSIVAEMVKPMENIDSIKIIDAQGFIGNGSNGKVSSGEVNTSFPDQVVNASLKHKALVPFMDNILKDLNLDVNLNSNNLNGIVEGFIGNAKTNSFEKVEAPINTKKEESQE